MQTPGLSTGSYGIKPLEHTSIYEDEHVGGLPPFVEGVVVTRVSEDKVFVREWKIHSHFEGKDCLEKFEEAKHNYDFEFEFSHEREQSNNDIFDGSDPRLKAQLMKKLP